MAQIPIAPVTRLVRNAGAERVSEDASVALVEILEAKGEEIAAKAVSLSKHAGRKTVKREDIVEACGPSGSGSGTSGPICMLRPPGTTSRRTGPGRGPGPKG